MYNATTNYDYIKIFNREMTPKTATLKTNLLVANEGSTFIIVMVKKAGKVNVREFILAG